MAKTWAEDSYSFWNVNTLSGVADSWTSGTIAAGDSGYTGSWKIACEYIATETCIFNTKAKLAFRLTNFPNPVGNLYPNEALGPLPGGTTSTPGAPTVCRAASFFVNLQLLYKKSGITTLLKTAYNNIAEASNGVVSTINSATVAAAMEDVENIFEGYSTGYVSVEYDFSTNPLTLNKGDTLYFTYRIETKSSDYNDPHILIRSAISHTLPEPTVTPTTYTVTLTPGNGIDTVYGAGTYNSGYTATIDATVSTGYTWSKWSDDVTTKRRTITVDRDYNLTASAILNSYSVTLGKGTGISTVTGAGTYNHGTWVTISATPSTGYSFTGWSDGDTSNPRTFQISGTVNLTANASPNSYTATFMLNDGTQGVAGTITKKYQEALGTLPSATRSGYRFAGWFTTASGATQISSSTTMPASNPTYYAHWNRLYTVTYYPNGGTTTPAVQSGIKDEQVTLAAALQKNNTVTETPVTLNYNVNNGIGTISSSSGNVVTTVTHTFNKWALGSTSGTTYAAGAKYTIPTTNSNFYATWNDSTPTTTYPTISITSSKPTRTGYTFLGWSSSSTATSPDYSYDSSNSNSITLSNNVTLYAVWAPNVYTITLNKNNGSGGTSTYYLKYNTGKYSNSNCTAAITKITCPTRTGYAFNGYYTDTNYTTQVIDKDGNITHINTAFSTDRELHAQWVENKLTVHYYSNKATKFIGESNLFTGTLSKDENIKIHSQEYPYESLPSGYTTISLRDYTHAGSLGMEKTGYTPTGYWNTKVDGSGTSIDQITEYANGQKIAEALGLDLSEGNAEVDVYAQWELEYDAFIRIKDGNTEKWAYAEAYCFDDGEWKKADVYIYNDDNDTFERPVFKDL